MGMTIDRAVEIINHYLDYPKEEVREALILAINTMRKYQKIKQIYINGRYDCECYNSYEAIAEVLENEEIDD